MAALTERRMSAQTAGGASMSKARRQRPTSTRSVPSDSTAQSRLRTQERSACTARRACPNLRAADGVTLFLDEIGDLPLPAQAALLRAVQEGEVLAVGSNEPARVDLRVIAATHQDLEDAVATQRFRADLYARIACFTLRLPPLRKRREDLGLLIAALLRKHGGQRATLTACLGRERRPLAAVLAQERRGERATLTAEAGRALLRH